MHTQTNGNGTRSIDAFNQAPGTASPPSLAHTHIPLPSHTHCTPLLPLVGDVCDYFEVDADKGLSAEEVEKRIAQFGHNELAVRVWEGGARASMERGRVNFSIHH